MKRLLKIAVLLLLPWSRAQADRGPDAAEVRAVLQTMRAEISARPSRVLIAVEDALTMNEQAACEIVKEAIILTRADAKLVGEIVFTALTHSPAMSATIVECAVKTAPEAAKEVELAMERALGKNAGTAAGKYKEDDESATVKAEEAESAASGKESSGKGMARLPTEDADADFLDAFLPGTVGVGGIYLVVPSHGAGMCHPGGPCCSGELSPSCLKP
jgi:hypothetical protein